MAQKVGYGKAGVPNKICENRKDELEQENVLFNVDERDFSAFEANWFFTTLTCIKLD